MHTQTQTHTQARMQPQMPPQAVPQRAPRTVPRTRGHRRIMLVTTRCSTLLALQRACRADQAVQFCFYANSAAAARALHRFRPDALVLDVACAGRAGLELVERVRMMETPPTVAVLADTFGSRMSEAVEHVSADGGLLATAPDLLERLGALASRRAEGRLKVA